MNYNTIKHLLSIIILCISFNTSVAQKLPKGSIAETFSQADIEALKKTKTIFFLRYNDLKNAKEYKKVLNTLWDFTEIEVADYRQKANYTRGNYSFMEMEVAGFTRTTVGGSSVMDGTYVYCYMTLTIPKYVKEEDKNKKKRDQSYFLKVDLMPSYETYLMISDKGKATKNYIYKGIKDYEYKNWTPSLLAIYLKNAQYNLNNLERDHTIVGSEISPKLVELKKEKLYILENALEEYSFTDEKGVMQDATDIFKDYEYSYEVITEAKLTEMIENKESFYLADYVKSQSIKMLTIYAPSGERIYHAIKPSPKALKAKDLKTLSKEISKAQK